MVNFGNQVQKGRMIFHTNSILIDENGDIDNNVFGLVEPSVSALQLNQYRDQIQI